MEIGIERESKRRDSMDDDFLLSLNKVDPSYITNDDAVLSN